MYLKMDREISCLIHYKKKTIKGNNMEQTKYDVFISYSRKDYVDENENIIPDNEVSKIMKALTDAGITYWIDKEGIYSGDKFTEALPKFIKSASVFVYLSTANANKSKYTSKEIAIADEYNKYIIPVRIDMTPYSEKVIFRIADVSYIKYEANPEKGREELIESVKSFLEKEEIKKKQKIAEEDRRKKALEEQRRQQEAEAKREKQIAELETEIAAEESRKNARKKIVLQKEAELKLAQVDLDDCEAKIKKLYDRLQRLKHPIEGEREAKAKHKAEEWPKERTFNIDGVPFKMIRVEGGRFQMGLPDNDSDAFDFEKPQHWVTLSDYYIGEIQVSQALWKVVKGTNPSHYIDDNRPVECVSWDDCHDFIKKLNSRLSNELAGFQFSLPTESQWEYAARGGKKSKGHKYSGSDNIDDVAWYDENSGCMTHSVKGKKANELGLYDMSGNVWEWCQNWFEDYSYCSQNDLQGPSDIQGPSDSSFRIVRGGSWYGNASGCRVARRNGISFNPRRNDIGFRLALVYNTESETF